MKWLSNLFGMGAADAPAPRSTATMKKTAGNVYELRIGGVLNKETLDKIQEFGAREIAAGTSSLRLLMILDGFLGWRKGDDWDDISFFVKYGSQISRIAAVADAQWKTKVLAFLGAGMRSGEVRFYTPDQEAAARAWLEEKT